MLDIWLVLMSNLVNDIEMCIILKSLKEVLTLKWADQP